MKAIQLSFALPPIFWLLIELITGILNMKTAIGIQLRIQWKQCNCHSLILGNLEVIHDVRLWKIHKLNKNFKFWHRYLLGYLLITSHIQCKHPLYSVSFRNVASAKVIARQSIMLMSWWYCENERCACNKNYAVESETEYRLNLNPRMISRIGK